jgi:hypothetical protein
MWNVETREACGIRGRAIARKGVRSFRGCGAFFSGRPDDKTEAT